MATRKSARRRRQKTGLAVFVLFVETAVALVLIVGLGWFWHFSNQLPNVDNLSITSGGQTATTIVSEDGVVLGTLDIQNRESVALDAVAKSVTDATVAIEDHRFWEHHGIDLLGIGRSVYANLRRENLTSQGGSTLTQQLVRSLNEFGLTRDKLYERKLREALTAIRVEQEYSKPEILQLYLNTIYYGAGAYGIQAAAKTYFGVPATNLTLGEAALLAGLPQRPAAFSPYDHMDAALKRRDEVLASMRTYGYITQVQEDGAKSEPLQLKQRRVKKELDFKAPYFVTHVLRELATRYGTDFVYSGLRIETTLNWKIQQLAEKTLEDGLKDGSSFGTNQGALVSLDPNTGYIRAMVGGRNFRADQYNAVTQGRRQPGSTFKLFDYTSAFDTDTCTLDSSFVDKPIPYPNDPKHRVVHNYGNRYTYRSMSCLTAIEHSVNTVAVQVASQVGIHSVIDYAHRMGITTKLDPYLPTALGASAVRPIDLCSAYTVIANKGSRYKPMGIVRIYDADKNIIEDHVPDEDTGIIRPETVNQIDTALQAVVTVGTGTHARGDQQSGIIDDAHGKTGTTSDNRDAWFAGYTHDLATVIWVANVRRGKGGRKSYLEMPGGTGGDLCAPIWHNFMIQAITEQRRFKLNPDAVVASEPKPAEMPHPERQDKPIHRKQVAITTPVPTPISPGAETDGTIVPATPDGNENADDGGNPPGDNTNGGGAGETAPLPPQTISPRGGLTDDPAHPGVDVVPSRVRRPQGDAPAPRSGAPPSDSAPKTVSVTVCVESGQLATEWCPETQQIKMSARKAARLRRCKIHHAPPGEE